ncbi:MAG: gene transfer agent family protein [Roseobacter sp.]
MANPWRGEVAIVIDGQTHKMRLTLGALAELEAQLEVGTLVALVERFESGGYSTADVLALLEAGLRGGQCGLDRAALLHGEIDGGPIAAARAAAELLARAFSVPQT